MRQAVAQNVVLPVSSPAVGGETPMVEETVVAAAADIVSVMLARCIARLAQAAAMKPKCLSSHETTDPSIAAIAISHNGQGVLTTAGLAGNSYDGNSGKAGRFV